MEPAFDYSRMKKSEWPAYQISGERTIRSFEQNWIGIQVRGANTRNITWLVEGPAIGRFDLHRTATLTGNSDAREVGEAVRYVAARSGASNGFTSPPST